MIKLYPFISIGLFVLLYGTLQFYLFAKTIHKANIAFMKRRKIKIDEIVDMLEQKSEEANGVISEIDVSTLYEFEEEYADLINQINSVSNNVSVTQKEVLKLKKIIEAAEIATRTQLENIVRQFCA
ncbi:MAG: hypothetical protein IJ875_02650 [Solobacterium sp.]|nr:hypothetical protein [Solobacterium sp.]